MFVLCVPGHTKSCMLARYPGTSAPSESERGYGLSLLTGASSAWTLLEYAHFLGNLRSF